jgi:hypothetical protein
VVLGSRLLKIARGEGVMHTVEGLSACHFGDAPTLRIFCLHAMRLLGLRVAHAINMVDTKDAASGHFARDIRISPAACKRRPPLNTIMALADGGCCGK